MSKRITHEVFLERAFNIHSDSFTYLTKYVEAKKYIKIQCNLCSNIFNQTPSNHIHNKRGCPKCSTKNGALKQSKTNERFLRQCKKLHGNKFIYLSDYINSRSMIKIKCLKCNNIFKQMATNHLDKGCGCPDCNRFVGYSIDKFSNINSDMKNNPAKLYFYKFWNEIEEFYKIGITTTIRDFGVKNIYDVQLVSEINTTLYNAILKEQKFINDFKEYKYLPIVKFKGWTECFRKEIYNVMFS